MGSSAESTTARSSTWLTGVVPRRRAIDIARGTLTADSSPWLFDGANPNGTWSLHVVDNAPDEPLQAFLNQVRAPGSAA
jgi:hypothetical protein